MPIFSSYFIFEFENDKKKVLNVNFNGKFNAEFYISPECVEKITDKELLHSFDFQLFKDGKIIHEFSKASYIIFNKSYQPRNEYTFERVDKLADYFCNIVNKDWAIEEIFTWKYLYSNIRDKGPEWSEFVPKIKIYYLLMEFCRIFSNPDLFESKVDSLNEQ